MHSPSESILTDLHRCFIFCGIPSFPLSSSSTTNTISSLLMPLRSDGLGGFHVTVQYIPSMAKICFSTEVFKRNELHFTHVLTEAEVNSTCIRLTVDGTFYNAKVDKQISVPLCFRQIIRLIQPVFDSVHSDSTLIHGSFIMTSKTIS